MLSHDGTACAVWLCYASSRQAGNANLFKLQIPGQLCDSSPVIFAGQHLPDVAPVTNRRNLNGLAWVNMPWRASTSACAGKYGSCSSRARSTKQQLHVPSPDGPGDVVHVLWLDDCLQVILQDAREVVLQL